MSRHHCFRFTRVGVALSCALAWGVSWSQTPVAPALSLDELTRLVLQYNPELQWARQARETAAAGVKTASAFANPELEFSAGRNRARMAGTTEGQVRIVNLSQFIDNPWVRSARIQAAQSGEWGAQQTIALTRNQVVAQAHLKAYEYQTRKEEERAAAESVALLEQVRERVQIGVNSGETPRYEIIKADAEIVNARLRRQTASAQAEQAMLSLNRLAAGQLPAKWALQTLPDDQGRQLDREAVLGQIGARNPELQVLKAEVSRLQSQLDGAKASVLPGVAVKLGQTQEPEVKQQTVGVSVSIPLFDRKTGPIAEASSELVRAQLKLDGRKAELQQQVQLAFSALELARKRVEALSQGAVNQAEAALRVAQAAYRFGERGILDVLDAQRVLRAARADLIDARYEVQAARIELALLTGTYADEPTSTATQP